MTTKYKIISGFLFMMALLAGMATFGYMRLHDATIGFDDYRAEARTAVNVNAADALMREAKNKIVSFVLSLDPALAEGARKDLEGSVKFLGLASEVETNSENRRKLADQQAQLNKMSQLTKTVQDTLLLADKKVKEQMWPAGRLINDQLTALNTAAAEANNDAMLSALDKAYSAYADARALAAVYSSTYLPADGENSYKHFQTLTPILKQMDGLIVRDEVRKAYTALMQEYDRYTGTFKEVDAAIKDSNRLRKELDNAATDASKVFDAYTSEAQGIMDKVGPATRESNNSAQKLLAIISAIGILIGAALAAWIILGVVQVLTRVSTFAGEIARGNFGAPLTVREGGEIGAMARSILAIPATLNEMTTEYTRLEQRIEEGHLDVQADNSKFSGGFADLVQGTNNILKRLGLIFNSLPSPVVVLNRDLKASYLNKVAQDLAGTDYLGKTCQELFAREDFGSSSCAMTNAVRTGGTSSAETVAHPKGRRMDIHYTAIPMKDAQGKLASVLQLIVDLTSIKDTERKIQEVARQALENADRVAAASEELSAQVEQVSRGADMQRSRVESTAAAMNEMNATVLEVARSAGNASEQSDETRKKADNGADLVNKVVKAINGVNSVALALQDNMKELGQQAESIGGVMNVISDIADQTNLLALNAAIEAARAGEAGRGFAVVADEVRKLAEKTMTATQEVGSNIQAIQNSARANIGEVTSAVKNITEATDLANASGQALSEIVSLAATNSSYVASIATAAEEQSATSEEINRALEDVSRVVSETADGMTQASAAVQDLSRVAQELRKLIERLRGN